MNVVLQDTTFRQLRDFIYGKCGIYINDTKKYLIENRLVKVLQENNLSSYEEYLSLMQSGNGNELSRLYDAITTNETFFFREQQQIDVLIDLLVPGIIKDKPGKAIQIWSAACSTGEEPYTIGMLLAEKQRGTRAGLIASDISEVVLESARKGIYGSYSVRNIPEPYLKKYFRSNGHFYEIDPAMRNSVKFLNVNLVDDRKVKTLRDIDVVLCRNVLIYFDDKMKQKAVSLLYDSLRPGGYLFIGLSESLHNVTRAFKPVVMNKVIVYQRS
ncbi:MAG: protein-glutamate O-methyltransferase CheR [Nitrospirae bacterium]|nr:protein-glutamate O-methyltransferase CheR [Nitrospirota bacterium]